MTPISAELQALLDRGVKALSVRTPWAWLIVADHKDVENRTWTTDYRGPLLIHAGYTVDPNGFAVAERFGVDVPPDPPRGGLIGVVELVDIRESAESPWHSPGHKAWLLANPRPLPFTPCRGRLGLFTPRFEE